MSFKTFVIALSGTFPDLKQGTGFFLLIGSLSVLRPHMNRADFPQADVKALIEQTGATFSNSVTEACTHLVTTQTDVDKKSAKCE